MMAITLMDEKGPESNLRYPTRNLAQKNVCIEKKDVYEIKKQLQDAERKKKHKLLNFKVCQRKRFTFRNCRINLESTGKSTEILRIKQ